MPLRVCAVTSLDRALLRCGQSAGGLFVSTFVLDGATRADYRPARHPVSSLALGPRGWLQKLNFAATGALYLAGAAGLARTRDRATTGAAGAVLISAASAGMCAAAVFTTDPVSGYPPGTPDQLTNPTREGRLHDLVSVLTFFGLPIAAGLYARYFARAGHRNWSAYSAMTGIGMSAAFALSTAGFSQAPRFVDQAGLWQRVCIATGFTWLTALMTHALHADQ